jgi:ribosomal-protein-alanine N-acetyltransferase
MLLREVEPADAQALHYFLSAPAVARQLSSVPESPEAFAAYIEWARHERAAGRHLSFAVVPTGWRAGVGVLQVWSIEQRFLTAEWGFALGQPFWGEGLFHEAATAFLSFAFDGLGVRRLEARAAVDNRPGNIVLERLGAVREGLLRRAFRRGGREYDHVLWAILADEWPGDAERRRHQASDSRLQAVGFTT